MQNNKSKGFRSFLKEKGYYIVLLLCAVAVGTSGYFLLRPSKTPTAEESSASVSQNEASAATTPSQKAADVIATDPSEETEPSAPTSPKRLTTVRPVDGDTLYAFAADHLAYNETTRDWRTHEGVDLSAPLGQEVVASADGSVYTIYEDESLGMTVVLRHTDGYTTHYSTLAEEISVKVGDTVSAGTVLGTVGQTACIETAAQPHLHFAVYQNNTPVDPEDFFNLS